DLDVIDLVAGAIDARQPFGAKRILNGLRQTCELADALDLNGNDVEVRDEEPVAAIRDVADDLADARHRHAHIERVAVRRHIRDGHGTVGRELRGHFSDRRIEMPPTWTNASQVLERAHDTDEAMTTHAE